MKSYGVGDQLEQEDREENRKDKLQQRQWGQHTVGPLCYGLNVKWPSQAHFEVPSWWCRFEFCGLFKR